MSSKAVVVLKGDANVTGTVFFEQTVRILGVVGDRTLFNFRIFSGQRTDQSHRGSEGPDCWPTWFPWWVGGWRMLAFELTLFVFDTSSRIRRQHQWLHFGRAAFQPAGQDSWRADRRGAPRR